MNFKDIIGQGFRTATGMPYKVDEYNVKLNIYNEVINHISEIEQEAISSLSENNNYSWLINEAKKISLESDLAQGRITNNEYVLGYEDIKDTREKIIANFVMNDELVNIHRNRLNSIKSRFSKNKIISLMNFDTWEDMKAAKELANLAALKITTSDKYIDAAIIADFEQRRRINNHIRKRG